MSTSDSNIVTRLASRSITGHELPIQVHQHYVLEFHLILKPNNKHDGSIETCTRRGFTDYCNARKVCLQLEKSALQGLCSCIYEERRVLYMSDKVEQCLRAKPIENQTKLCNCSLCTPHTEEMLAYDRWVDKAFQDCV